MALLIYGMQLTLEKKVHRTTPKGLSTLQGQIYPLRGVPNFNLHIFALRSPAFELHAILRANALKDLQMTSNTHWSKIYSPVISAKF